jgi:3-dehydroquinate synthase
MYSDKKKIDRQLRFVLLDSIGHAFLHGEDVAKAEVLGAIDDAMNYFRQSL